MLLSLSELPVLSEIPVLSEPVLPLPDDDELMAPRGGTPPRGGKVSIKSSNLSWPRIG